MRYIALILVACVMNLIGMGAPVAEEIAPPMTLPKVLPWQAKIRPLANSESRCRLTSLTPHSSRRRSRHGLNWLSQAGGSLSPTPCSWIRHGGSHPSSRRKFGAGISSPGCVDS